MRLKNYITELTGYKKKQRGKEISIDDIVRLSNQYSDALLQLIKKQNSVIMVRVLYNHNKFDYRYINPKKEDPRVSANTLNYYTLIIDNSKKWSQYPKRSQSIICANITYPKMPHYYYWVVPKNGAKIGECPSRDIWSSFKNIDSMSVSFNDTIKLLLNIPYVDNVLDDNSNVIIKDKNISEFKKACKDFDKWFKNQDELSLEELKDNFNYLSWFQYWKGEPLYNFLEKTLDPKLNGFKIKNIKNLTIRKETWTDSECLIISHDSIPEVIESVQKKLK